MKLPLSLCSITVIMMFFETPPLTHAKQQQQQQQQKFKRKTSTNNDATAADPSQQENYIITHYGVEYYTPATESSSSSVQMHNDGYFTAEIIPVDPKTGEELKTINNLYVPLHTGYSIGTDHQRAQHFAVAGNDGKVTNSRETDHQPQSTNVANKSSPSSSKRKFDKKYKLKNADAVARKNSTMRIASVRSEAESSTRGQDDKNKSNSNASVPDDANRRNQKFSAN